MNVEQVLTLAKQFTFIGLKYQNLASFLLWDFCIFFYKKFVTISSINKTCFTNHKNFPITHDLAHLCHLAVKQTAKA